MIIQHCLCGRASVIMPCILTHCYSLLSLIMMPTTNTEISHQRKSSSSISLSQSTQSVSVQVIFHFTLLDTKRTANARDNLTINSDLVIMSKVSGYWPPLSRHSHLTRLRFRRHLYFYSLGQSLVWWWTIDFRNSELLRMKTGGRWIMNLSHFSSFGYFG